MQNFSEKRHKELNIVIEQYFPVTDFVSHYQFITFVTSFSE